MKKGFTLIELLIVIAILGGLAGLLIPNFMEARKDARDTQRKNDIKQIQKAFELYKLDQNPPKFPDVLPASGVAWTGSGNTYMNKFPSDPQSPTHDYKYKVDNTALTYTLCACLENSVDPQGTDCSSASPPCSCGSFTKCYIVNQP